MAKVATFNVYLSINVHSSISLKPYTKTSLPRGAIHLLNVTSSTSSPHLIVDYHYPLPTY